MIPFPTYQDHYVGSRNPDAWLTNARCYLRSALCLVNGSEKAYFTPCLQLTGLGIELLLKSNLLRNGKSLGTLKRQGHNLLKLWRHPTNSNIRKAILETAPITWECEKADGTVPLKDHVPYSEEDFLNYLRSLHHVYANDHLVRYPVEDTSVRGPAPFQLITSFLYVADRIAGDSNFLDKPTA
jgi:hypothetical protein